MSRINSYFPTLGTPLKLTVLSVVLHNTFGIVSMPSSRLATLLLRLSAPITHT